MSPGRWLRRLIPPALLPASLLAGTLSLAVTQAAYGYQASVDVNETAFDVCDGTPNSIPSKMLSAAVSAYKAIGYSTSGFTGSDFTKARTLNRTDDDWGFFVHSHGDYYWDADAGRRYTGFREDSGDCSQKVVFSNEIKAARAGRQSNLVFVSTCHASDSNTTMPGAFAISKTKYDSASTAGPEFYVGYVGVQWDSDEWLFEQRFWNALTDGAGTGASFDRAMAGSYGHSSFDADWWGAYHWSGKAGPLTVSCPNCA
ncbi:MAG TPA: hypothetical protein VFS32_15070 [Candidatus Limnocylindrales bacterium]|nr:hypothetical protein [Candidatus Limnocylindrales bacterium]